MRMWIICTGGAEPRRSLCCDAAGFDALCREEAGRGVEPPRDKPIRAEGFLVYTAPGRAAEETARLVCPGAEAREEPLLTGVPCRSWRDTRLRLPLWLWRLMARWQRLRGSPRQDESRQQTRARAEALLDRLEAAGRDCVLVTPPSFAAVLIDRLRLRGCVATRSGLLRLRPLERILVTRRDAHCGGCRHNCLLSDPGCGVGRDKAARRSG